MKFVGTYFAGGCQQVHMSSPWTPQQEAIFADVASGAGHTIVLARAGCGKTSTLVEAVGRIDPKLSVLFLAFNKAIAAELEMKIGGRADVHTCHSFGLRVLRRALPHADIDTKKVWKASKDLPHDRADLCNLVSLGKAALAQSTRQFCQIAEARGLEQSVALAVAAKKMLEVSYDTCRSSFDFDDMIWLPNELDCTIPQFDLVFVDELQDLTPAQVELATHAVKPGGRIVAAGDNYQAVYQFRGAGNDSVYSTRKRLNAKTLPLTTTFRCARSIVKEANRWVPDIEARESAPEGVVRHAPEAELLRSAALGDFVLARLNAPLLSVAWKMVAAGTPCTIAGHDFGKALIKLIQSQGTKVSSVSELRLRLSAWAAREQSKSEVEGTGDKLACALALCAGAADIAEVVERARNLFSEKERAVRFSSTHRAKGLEADRVWLLWNTYLRSRSRLRTKHLGASNNQEQVEFNLAYVGVTRARRELIYVEQDRERRASK